MRNFVIYRLPALFWAACILSSSGEHLSSNHTRGFLGILLAHLLAHLSDAGLEAINFLFRKGGHVAAYGALSWLGLRAVRMRLTGWQPAWCAVAVGCCLVVASLDEWRQSFFPSRTGTVRDVLLDVGGALVVQALLAWRARRSLLVT